MVPPPKGAVDWPMSKYTLEKMYRPSLDKFFFSSWEMAFFSRLDAALKSQQVDRDKTQSQDQNEIGLSFILTKNSKLSYFILMRKATATRLVLITGAF